MKVGIHNVLLRRADAHYAWEISSSTRIRGKKKKKCHEKKKRRKCFKYCCREKVSIENASEMGEAFPDRDDQRPKKKRLAVSGGWRRVDLEKRISSQP